MKERYKSRNDTNVSENKRTKQPRKSVRLLDIAVQISPGPHTLSCRKVQVTSWVTSRFVYRSQTYQHGYLIPWKEVTG